MNRLFRYTVVIQLVTVYFCMTTQAQRVRLVNNEEARSVEVVVDGCHFTSYMYPDTGLMKKSILFPVRSYTGALVTRGWPLEPRPDERIDHPHHVGVWMNYEDVNGIDFWNNSNVVDPNRKHFGTIVHTGIKSIRDNKWRGTLKVTADWLDRSGNLILSEETKYVFRARGTQRIVDRFSKLKAVNGPVDMKDVKDGFFAIRVAHELDHPSKQAEFRTDRNGQAGKTKTVLQKGVTGHYRNSNGIEGEEVWGKKAIWCNLMGTIQDEDISVAIIDHPQNPGYPSYWHARGYGLFAINPLGVKSYDKSKEAANLQLKQNESVTFRFRLVIDSKHLNDSEMNALAADFANVK